MQFSEGSRNKQLLGTGTDLDQGLAEEIKNSIKTLTLFASRLVCGLRWDQQDKIVKLLCAAELSKRARHELVAGGVCFNFNDCS